MKKELRGWDRVQALIRNPKYLEDYNEYSKLEMFKDQNYFQKRDNLLKKWELNSPVNPEEYRDKKTSEHFNVFSNNSYNNYPVRFLPFKKELMNKEEIAEALKRFKHKSSSTGKVQGEKTVYLRDKRFLRVEIDLTFGRDDIKSDVDEIVRSFQTILRKDTGRNTETVLSPWEIYNMHEKKNTSQIAKELSGIYKNPSDDEIVMAKYNQIKRAKNKACKMIEEVGTKARKKDSEN
jgi:hypothetical protein